MTRTLAEAAADAATCPKCRLAETRTQVVFGVGDPDADLMFIGEAPGFHEDKQGEPFVGAAGQLLTRMLGEIGLRREDVYIANVLKCRPPANRDPLPDEIETCTPWLVEQLSIIQPSLVGTLGNFATKFVLNTSQGITCSRSWFLIPAEAWSNPSPPLVERDYEGKSSKPEIGPAYAPTGIKNSPHGPLRKRTSRP